MKKTITLLCVCMIFLSGCRFHPLMHNHNPVKQPGTTWETEDGRVIFSVSDDDLPNIIGQIHTEDSDVSIQLHIGLYSSVFEVTYKVYEQQRDQLIIADEIWNTCTVTKNKFVVEIIESNYFEEGEVLTFYKVK